MKNNKKSYNSFSVKSNSTIVVHHVVHLKRQKHIGVSTSFYLYRAYIQLSADEKQSDTDIEGTWFHTMEWRGNFSSPPGRQQRRYDQYKLLYARGFINSANVRVQVHLRCNYNRIKCVLIRTIRCRTGGLSGENRYIIIPVERL